MKDINKELSEEEKDIDKELMSLYSGIVDDDIDIDRDLDFYDFDSDEIQDLEPTDEQ